MDKDDGCERDHVFPEVVCFLFSVSVSAWKTFEDTRAWSLRGGELLPLGRRARVLALVRREASALSELAKLCKREGP